ncbi:MAG: sulfite exporter TauE/SafE family protein [Bacteroidales bacterium]
MELIFILLIFITAWLYSSIGHGGASGYLALMALFGVGTMYMRASALLLNLFVAGISFAAYYRAGYFRFRLLLPFIIGSMPTAYLGAMIKIDPHIYKIILGICLLIAIGRILYKHWKPENSNYTLKKPHFLTAVLIGIILGFLAGMIGIGGGIILSPLLILFKWATIKESSAVSSGFIWLNSLTGLLGTINTGITIPPEILLWILTALTGGWIGSYIGSIKFSNKKLGYILSVVLVLASIKLMFA